MEFNGAVIGSRLRRTSVVAPVLVAALQANAPLARDVRAVAVTPQSIPLARGVTIVQAVTDPRGDYEATFTLAPATAEGVGIEGKAFKKDDAGTERWITVRRFVRSSDLHGARRQIFGFHESDPNVIEGTTAIGPSLAVVRELVRNGQADHPIQNEAKTAPVPLTFHRMSTAAFPLVVNGKRVTVTSLVARASLGRTARVIELHILDHPAHPITLKAVCCIESAGGPASQLWIKQVVRIDFAEPTTAVAERLVDDCRATLPGIYFEFNSDVLNPASAPALEQLAQLLRQRPAWRLEIEGHTDNVGGADYNLDLSARRAGSVKAALVSVHGIAPARLTTRGHGPTRPVESNDTVEGRAMNRRVELVRPC